MNGRREEWVRVLRPAIDRLRAVARTAVFLLKVLPMLPSLPVDWVTRRPFVERVTYPTASGSAEGDLYRPSRGGHMPGVLVCLGVVPFGVDHPQVARLGEALARAGFAALLYWSPAMRDRRLDPADAGDIAIAYQWLIEREYVDEARSGLLGTCVGGSFALLAASQADIRDRVAFVAAFAPYASMETFVRDIASGTQVRNGIREAWPVDQLTHDVYVRTLLASLTSDERSMIAAAVATPEGAPDSRHWSKEAVAVYGLLEARGLEAVTAAMQGLPSDLSDQLAALSPLPSVAEIHAPLIVVGHDRDDQVIPVSESRQLVEALAAHTGVHYTEFAFFQHATPRKLAILPMLRELGRFAGYVYPLFRLTVA